MFRAYSAAARMAKNVTMFFCFHRNLLENRKSRNFYDEKILSSQGGYCIYTIAQFVAFVISQNHRENGAIFGDIAPVQSPGGLL